MMYTIHQTFLPIFLLTYSDLSVINGIGVDAVFYSDQWIQLTKADCGLLQIVA